MEKVWHRILVRAGVIVGYRHTCRRCVARKQPATHEFPNAEQRRCPTCNMRIWPSAIPRPMRFHDVQRILRHANIRTTVDTYGHLANEDLRAPLELLPAPTERALPSPIRPRHVPNMCQAARNPEKQGPGADSKSATAGPIFLERNTGFEPATFALARRTDRVTNGSRSCTTITNHRRSFGDLTTTGARGSPTASSRAQPSCSTGVP